ncbi:type II toxin-antitoxin system RelE/ParE family toxin [Ferrovibrio sp.]|uniref:type II toxin-antitoxin system RelE/ParE family toxin n=1 Tax=Ferrovibrio sp. TaxID=1917215 RepID=UPI00311DC4E5
MLKELLFVGGAYKEFRGLPEATQREFGHGLWLAQKGEMPGFAKPLKGFGGASVIELLDDRKGEAYRAVYTIRFEDAVYVLAAFHKKAKSGIDLPQRDKDLIRQRLGQAREMHEAAARRRE